jgi:hypothetical protein
MKWKLAFLALVSLFAVSARVAYSRTASCPATPDCPCADAR